MNGPLGQYICLRCRQSFKNLALRFLSAQQASSRTFVSLSTSNEATKDDSLKTEEGQHQKSNSTLKRRSVVHSGLSNEILENLFISTNRKAPPPPAKSRYSNTLNTTLVEYDENRKLLKHDIASLEHMLYAQNAPLDEIWAKCKEIRCVRHSQYNRPSIGTLEIYQNTTVFRDILLAVLRQRTVLKELTPTIKVAEVIREYVEKGLMHDWWNLVFWNLLGTIAESRQKNSQEVSTGEGKHGRLEESLLQDVLEVGQLYHNMYQDPPKHHSGNALPTVSSTRIALLWQKVLSLEHVSMDVSHRDPQLAPSQSNSSARTSVLALSLTYLYLQDRLDLSPTSRGRSPSELKIFSLLASAILRVPNLSQVELQSYLSDKYLSATMIKSAVHEWESLRSCYDKSSLASQPEIKSMIDPISLSSLESHLNERRVVPERSHSGILEQLQEAQLHKNIEHASLVWNHFKKNIKKLQNSSSGDNLATDDHSFSVVFESFLKTFTKLGQLEKAVDVWNNMAQSGFQPGENHWITMLKACVSGRDTSSLRNVWRSMIVRNLRPSNDMWTVYIRGLVQSRSWDSTLSALEEMGKAWLVFANDESFPSSTTSDQNDLHQQYRPSMVPINTAISGFIGFEREKTAQSVLKWAISQGIKPDTVTYNILLRPAVRNNQNKEVARILKEMEKDDCQPDVGTFTILLDGLFRNPTSPFQSQAPEEQEKAISRVFQDMQDNGIIANNRTYSTILDSLLSPRQFNLAAAGAVLARMMELNIKPSRDIYTILVTHHFSSNPPNLDAIDRLWERIRREKTPVDHVFYDRMIENYSRIGQVEKALGFLRLMPRLGKTPGWLALHGVLEALVRVEKWDMVKSLLEDVVDPDRLFKHGTRGWKGEVEFWGLVDALQARGLQLPERPPQRRSTTCEQPL
ncbi:hypothetical protein MMC14_001339 [Varicellaria rhodocarpa]|nr:hypothetical protein [Varicellaria rhodocarpa]